MSWKAFFCAVCWQRMATVKLHRIDEAAQFVASAWVLQLSKCFGFDLTNALARDVKLFAHFFKRVVG